MSKTLIIASLLISLIIAPCYAQHDFDDDHERHDIENRNELLQHENLTKTDISDTYKFNKKKDYEDRKIIIKLTDDAMDNIPKGFNDLNIVYLTLSDVDSMLAVFPASKITQLHPLIKISPRTEKRIELTKFFMIEFAIDIEVKKMVNSFNNLSSIEYAEPSYINYADVIPDDTRYDDQWCLEHIGCEEAWEIHKGEDGETEIVVGICDSGTQWDHSDLIGNLYQNLGEDADEDGSVLEYIDGEWVFDPDDINGVDDDGNGETDDFIGWNFYTSDGTDENDPWASTYNTHGTHVAGLAAAVTDNENGIASVSWNVKFLPTKHGNNSGGSSIYNAYSGLTYLADMGVDVINCSWGGYTYSSYSQTVIDYVVDEDIVIFASAGNGNSLRSHYPSGYLGVISVASTDSEDEKSSFSDYGLAVDISSPGSSLLSTVPDNSYTTMSGTSMASPLAAGAFALLKSYRDDWTVDELLQQFLGSAADISDENPDYEGWLGYGRIDMYNALDTDDADIPDDLKLDVKTQFTDENGNYYYDPGETIDIEFTVTNYNPLYGSDALNYEVTCDDDDITIVNGTGSFSIDNDDSETVSSVSFEIDEDINDNRIFTLEINFSCDEGIAFGEVYYNWLVVNNFSDDDIYYVYNAFDPYDDYYEGPMYFYLNDINDISELADQSSLSFLSSGTWLDDKWYACDYDNKNLLTVNTTSGDRTIIGNTENTFNGMAFDVETGQLFGVTSTSLFSIDPNTGKSFLIGSNSGRAFVNLAADPDGNLYSIDIYTDMFGSFDKSTGEFTELFHIGYDLIYAQDMEYDHENDLFIIAAYGDSFNSFLGLIDVDNEIMALITEIPNSMELTSLAIPFSPMPFTLKQPYHRSKMQPIECEFEWRDHSDATSYTIIVSENEDLSDPIINYNTANTDYTTTTDLDYETKYYWKVNARSSSTVIDQTEVWEFTTVYECYEEPTDIDDDGYILISNICQLRWISENPSSWTENYRLENDIDASDTESWYVGDHDDDTDTPDEAMGWKPIGEFEYNCPSCGFQGGFDGNNYKISDLYINRPAAPEVGFFGCLSNGSYIQDLTLENVDFTGYYYIGTISGRTYSYNYSTGYGVEIHDCVASGSISGNRYIGGLIGYNRGWNGSIMISNCSSLTDIYTEWASYYIGGFTGYDYCSSSSYSFNYNNCFSSGGIYLDSYGYYCGGFLGYFSGYGLNINECYSLSSFYDDAISYYSGGFCGYLSGEAEISNCFARGDFTDAYYSGGFFGYSTNSTTSISNCYSTGGSENDNSYGFGYYNYGTVTNCFWDTETSGTTDSDGGTGKTTEEMQQESTFTDWDFDDIWAIDSDINDGYPFLINTYIDGFLPPRLITPDNNASSQSTSLTFVWNAVTDATGYDIQVSTSSSFTSTIVDESTTETEYDVSGLNEASVYYWRVRATNGDGETIWSSVWSFSTTGFGELGDYIFNQFIDEYEEITEGTVLVDGSSDDDDSDYFNNDIGFDFVYNGEWYDEFHISNNCYIWFSDMTYYPLSSVLSSTSTYDVITPFSRDMKHYSSNSSTCIFETIGVSPDRVCVIQWKDISPFGSSGNTMNFQIRLYETSNNIEFIYGSFDNSLSNTVQVGLKGTTTDNYRNRSVLETGDWEESTEGTDISNTCRFNSTLYPPEGLVYQWSTALRAPELISPEDNSDLTDPRPEFTWNDVNSATSYTLQVSTSSSFTTTEINETLTVTSYTSETDLEYNTEYFWRVQAHNDNQDSQWSDVRSFEVSNTTLEAPDLVSPIDDATDQNTSLTLDWNSVSGATGYDVQLSTSSDFSTTEVDESTTDTEYDISGLDEDTEYFWRVRATDSDTESDWSSIWSFETGDSDIQECPWTFTDETGSNATIIVQTSIEPTIGDRDFADGDAIGAFFTDDGDEVCAGYGVWDGNNMAFSVWGDDQYTDDKDGFSDNEDYILKAWDAQNGETLDGIFTVSGGPDYFSANGITFLGSFSTQITPPTQLYPSNNSTDINTSTSLSWSEVSSVTSYHLQVSTSNDFSTTIVDNDEITDEYYNLSDLDNLTTYYWRVKTLTSSDESDWSSIWSFETEAVPVPWTFTNETGSNATIIVQTSIEPTIGDRDFADGDAIGAFFTDDGDEVCAGFGVWDGNNMAFSVWGDDQYTDDKDGFSDNEDYILKAWDAQNGETLDGIFTVSQGPDYYTNNGISFLGSFSAQNEVTHSIDLSSGWSIISSYVEPEDTNVETIMVEIEDDLLLMKNVSGNIYMPSLDINNLGDWDIYQGYQIYMTDANTLEITGQKLEPTDYTYDLDAGWRMISYIRDNDMNVETALSAIEDDLLICKNGSGDIYMPSLDINNLGDMQPGEGYKLYMSADGELTYPSNSSPRQAIAGRNLTPKATFIKPELTRTGSNMTLIVRTENISDGSEIGIWTTINVLVGSGKVHNGKAAITVWGDNEQTEVIDGARVNENLKAMVFDKESGMSYEIELANIHSLRTSIVENNLTYSKDDIVLCKAVETGETQSELLLSVRPNPTTGETTIEYLMPKDSYVSIKIYTMTGQLIDTISESEATSGSHTLTYDVSKLANGVYNLQMIVDGKSLSRLLVVSK